MPKGSSGSGSSRSTASTRSTPSVRLNADRTFDQRSSMFRSGEAYLKSDGTLDGRCSAARQGIIGTTSSGQADLRFSVVKDAPQFVNKQEILTKDIRMPCRQQKYADEHPTKNPEKTQVDHILSLKIVKHQIQRSPSSLSTDALDVVTDVINSDTNMRQRYKESNITDNNITDNKIIDALDGKQIIGFTRF
ncbi:Hypothetical_protein [Hexamita inflata]|uniref:Hypothetical_protein n=1 Tax=Hexamita inflata TaxID=28002 RepID=A0AA86NDL6_9EUKA|nr:Hypothetical protein HINF_LOCUS5467 [Hexamita inflata]